jgi:uncharacterized membrane protein YheB (UPF0754 family)
VTHPVLLLLLRWAGPPVLGAIVGYAFVAIGLRLGFLRASSRGRRAAAAGLGRLAAKSLITETAVRAALHSPPVVDQVTKSVSRVSRQLLETSVTKLAQSGAAAVVSSQGIVTAFLKPLLGSRAFIYLVRDLSAHLVESLSGRKLQEMLARLSVGDLLSERVLAPLSMAKNRRTISRSIAEAFLGQADHILGDDVLEKAAALVEPALPHAAERIILWLKSPETRAYLSEQGRDLLPRILEKLNLLQRFLLSAGQFDRRLTEKMPEIVDETIATLQGIVRDPTQQRRILRATMDAARDWRHSLSSVNREKNIESIAGIFEKLLARLDDTSVRRSLAALIEKRLLASELTLGGIARQLTGRSEAELADSLSSWALSVLTRKETIEMLSRSLSSFAGTLRDTGSTGTLGELLGMDENRKAAADEKLASYLVNTLDSHLIEALQDLDVEKLVAQAVETIDARLLRGPVRAAAGIGAAAGLVIGVFELFLGMVL